MHAGPSREIEPYDRIGDRQPQVEGRIVVANHNPGRPISKARDDIAKLRHRGLDPTRTPIKEIKLDERQLQGCGEAAAQAALARPAAADHQDAAHGPPLGLPTLPRVRRGEDARPAVARNPRPHGGTSASEATPKPSGSLSHRRWSRRLQIPRA